MATIRDVAKLADVSIASVSRIMNNDETYKATDETRNRVFTAINQLGYKPLKKLPKKNLEKQFTVGCITNITTDRYTDSYYMAILAGIENYLTINNCSLEFAKSQYDLNNPESFKQLENSHPDGIILMASIERNFFDVVKANTRAIVGVDTTYNEIDNVRYNRFETGIRAMNYLIGCGHTKIAYLGSLNQHYTHTTPGRFAAYKFMMSEYNLPISKHWICDCNWERQKCFDKTVELMHRDDRPTAIFVASDHMAMACMSALFQLGLNVPNDISIIGISDIEESKYLNPPLTTMAIPKLDMSILIADTLLHRIHGDATPIKQLYVPTTLIERSSVKKII